MSERGDRPTTQANRLAGPGPGVVVPRRQTVFLCIAHNTRICQRKKHDIATNTIPTTHSFYAGYQVQHSNQSDDYQNHLVVILR